ncbi:MAG TPA: hypothetical protein P5561_00205 [Candidatus Omnitrophota bacterium]|nr:hypothetical protein [Candidatus Omnitrophota bacterium]HRY84935.1 hypothetical protein [Candidatus Omnitrophota bacterium]
MSKFLSVVLAVAMVFCFACSAVMAENPTAKETGDKFVDASKKTGEGIGKGTVAAGKAVGQTVVNTGSAVVDIGKTVVEGTGSILKPVATLGQDTSEGLEEGAKELEEKK